VIAETTPYFPPAVSSWQETYWLFLNGAIFLAWWVFFARRYSREFSQSERLLAAFVATIGQIEAAIFITGWLHILGWWETVSLTTFLTLIVNILAFTGRSGNNFGVELSTFLKTFWKTISSSAALWVLIPLAAFGFGWYMYLGQLLPPMCYDAWGYHLSWAALAHQERHLGPFDLPFPYINNFPKNTDMLFLWSIIGAGTERWANIVQGFFSLAAVLSCYILGKRIGATRRDALACSLLVLSVPVILHMQWKEMVDLAIMGATLASLAFIARNRITYMSVVLAGVMTGFILGTKGSTIYFVVPIAILLIYRMFPLGMNGFKFVKKSRFKFSTGVLLTWIVLTFIFGSYFYLRNWVETGNPTGFYNVDIAGYRFFEGTDNVEDHFSEGLLNPKIYDALEEGPEWPIVLDGFFDPQTFFTQGNRIGGWGPVWTLLILPAIPIALLWALIRRRWKVLAIVICCLLPFFLFKYNHTWTRYHLIVIGGGIISFAYILSLLRQTQLRSLLLGIACAMMLLGLFISGSQTIVSPEEINEARRAPYEESDRYIFFDSWNSSGFSEAQKTVLEAGTTVGLAHRAPYNKTLAFWNPYFTNRVLWTPWETPGTAWHATLVSKHVNYLYVAVHTGVEEYAVRNPQLFDLIYKDNRGSLFQVVKPGENDGG